MGYLRELVVFSGVVLIGQQYGWMMGAGWYLSYLLFSMWQESRRIIADQAVIDSWLVNSRQHQAD